MTRRTFPRSPIPGISGIPAAIAAAAVLVCSIAVASAAPAKSGQSGQSGQSGKSTKSTKSAKSKAREAARQREARERELVSEREVVLAVQRSQLHVRPGEEAPIIGHAEEGEELEVVGDRGRWLRVRAGKRVGWLTRTEVSPLMPAEPRNRPERSGFSGKPVSDAVKVTIAIDRVRGFDDPRSKSTNVLDLVRGDVVTVIGRGHDGWLMVQHDNGGVGWIPASVVSDAGKFAKDPRVAPAAAPAQAGQPAQPGQKGAPAAPAAAALPVAEVSTTAEPPAAGPWLRGAVVATGGAQTFQMQQTGEGDPRAIATGPVVAVAARAQMRVRGAIWLGAAASAELGTAELTYYGAETSAPMATRELAVDAHAELGWGDRWHVAARGGVHYATLSVDSERDESMLVGERIGGATVGLGGALPIGRRFAVSASVDVMPAGAQRMSRVPAGALQATAVRGAWARSALTIALPARLVAAISYRFGALTAELSDAAAMPKTATRADQSHLVTAGVGMAW
jgi:uncharacterized protein YgiM (DUF1202 family)